MTDQMKESLKELARTGLMAAIPVVVQALSTNTVDWRSVVVGVAIAVLSAIDKWLHAHNTGTLGNGLFGV